MQLARRLLVTTLLALPAPLLVPAAASAGPSLDSSGIGALAWTLLVAGAVLLAAVVSVGVWLWHRDALPPLPQLGRRRPPPPPPFLSTRPAHEPPPDADRFFIAGEQQPERRPSFAAPAQPDVVPAVALAGAAVLAVAALGAGVVVAASGGAAAPSRAAAQDTLGPRIATSDPSLCLAATTATDGAPLILRFCDGSATQRWEAGGDGTIRLAGRCMDVAGAAKAKGTILQLADCNGNPAQQFAFAGPTLVSKLTGNCVDVKDEQVTAGAAAVIASCATAGQRAWRQLP